MMKRWLRLLAFFCAAVCFCVPALAQTLAIDSAAYPVTRDGWYSTKEEVAVYLATYGHLPGNYLTKRQAENLGWSNRAGNLDKVAPGCSIGGDRFGNYEGQLPDAKGRKWTECDIGYTGGYRGGERILFSNDGLIYYTNDHYNTFTQIEVVAGKTSESPALDKDGSYTSKEDVAAYLHQFGQLPGNYLTRSQAKELGWSNKKDNLAQAAPGRTIGGDVFQNREKKLPDAKGRTWYECDINTADGKRGKERLVYSSDGLIYYTGDNYKTFTQLYERN